MKSRRRKESNCSPPTNGRTCWTRCHLDSCGSFFTDFQYPRSRPDVQPKEQRHDRLKRCSQPKLWWHLIDWRACPSRACSLSRFGYATVRHILPPKVILLLLNRADGCVILAVWMIGLFACERAVPRRDLHRRKRLPQLSLRTSQPTAHHSLFEGMSF